MKTIRRMIELRKGELDQQTAVLRTHIGRPLGDTVINFIN